MNEFVLKMSLFEETEVFLPPLPFSQFQDLKEKEEEKRRAAYMICFMKQYLETSSQEENCDYWR